MIKKQKKNSWLCSIEYGTDVNSSEMNHIPPISGSYIKQVRELHFGFSTLYCYSIPNAYHQILTLEYRNIIREVSQMYFAQTVSLCARSDCSFHEFYMKNKITSMIDEMPEHKASFSLLPDWKHRQNKRFVLWCEGKRTNVG